MYPKWSPILVSCVCVLVVTSAAAASPDPSDIFAKHEAAIGFSLADGKTKPYLAEATSTWTADGEQRTAQRTLKRAGIYFRENESYRGVTHAFGFDGQVFWHSDGNGNLAGDSGYARPFDVTYAVIDSEAYDASLTPELKRTTDVDYVVRIHPPSGVAADIYFNKVTYFIDKTVVEPEGDALTDEYADYQRKGPVTIAMTTTADKVVTKVSKFVWDAPLTVDELQAPPQRGYATFPASGTTTLPFAKPNYDGVIVEATINGVKGKFLIDTGSGDVFLNHGFAEHAKLKPIYTGEASGIGGLVKTYAARVDTMTVGDMSLSNFVVDVSSTDFDQFDGLIGYGVLAQSVCSIDFDKKAVTFANPATYKDDGTRPALIFALDQGTPQIQATLNQKAQVFMDLDLGDASSITLTRSFVDRNPGIVPREFGATFIGVGGLEEASIGLLAEIDIGPFRFFGLQSDVLLGQKGFSAQNQLQGLVGYQVLRRFNVTFDYPQHRMYLALSKYGLKTRFK
jgi:predicted aspartyl protease